MRNYQEYHNGLFIFLKKITELGHKRYEEYLQSPHWQGFRKRYFRVKSTKKYCLVCVADGTYNFEVELHHKTYSTLGAERLYDVIPVCRIHHELIHILLRDNHKGDVECTPYVLTLLAPKRKVATRPLHTPDNRRRVKRRRRGGHSERESEE